MRFTKFIKDNIVELVFVLLIILFFYLYFVVYMTPSRIAWYTEMQHQINILIYEITHIGR